MLREWLDQTHSRRFELCRHFFVRLFDSELISDASQAKVVAGGAIGILLSLSLIFGQAYYHKYRMLLDLDSPEPFHQAVRGDALFLITLAMLASALFTALQWQALFPGLRDYLALAALPARMSEIFVAKFAALFAMAIAVIAAEAAPPSVIIPAMMAGRYSYRCVWHVPGICAASMLGGLFVFFTLVAFQGALLNLLPVRQFPRVSLAFQGVSLAALAGALPFVFSIPDFYNRLPKTAAWPVYAPPFWFFGIDQFIFGARDAQTTLLARIALCAVPTSAASAILMYLWSYRRHRIRVLEAPSTEPAVRAFWPAAVSGRLLARPRTIGVFAFIWTTVARSRQHRLILTAFTAISVALIADGFSSVVLDGRIAPGPFREAVIAIPLALSLFFLSGLRYLFRLPVELRANWLFRVTEPGHASELAAGIDGFLIYCGAIPIALVTFPIVAVLLGARTALLVSLTSFLISLVLVEFLLLAFSKIPFTSSYMPGQRPLIETILKFGSVALAYVSGLAIALNFIVKSIPAVLAACAILAIAWQMLRRARIASHALLRFEFEDAMEPAVQRLEIERD